MACAGRSEGSTEAPAVDLRVVTWNANVDRGSAADIRELANDLQPDLLLLQEVEPAWMDDLEPLDALPHRAEVRAPDGGGLLTLSRWPLREVEVRQAETGWFPAWRGVAETPLGPLELMNVHLVPPFADTRVLSLPLGYLTLKDDRLAEARSLVPAESPPQLIAGDFNANERERALRYLRSLGLESALPQHSRQRTWSYPGLPIWWRIDHVLVDTQRLEILDARVLRWGPSDHWPVLVELAGR